VILIIVIIGSFILLTIYEKWSYVLLRDPTCYCNESAYYA